MGPRGGVQDTGVGSARKVCDHTVADCMSRAACFYTDASYTGCSSASATDEAVLNNNSGGAGGGGGNPLVPCVCQGNVELEAIQYDVDICDREEVTSEGTINIKLGGLEGAIGDVVPPITFNGQLVGRGAAGSGGESCSPGLNPSCTVDSQIPSKRPQATAP
jgi:hypothetical protein